MEYVFDIPPPCLSSQYHYQLKAYILKIIALAKECIRNDEQLGEFVDCLMNTVERNEAEKKYSRDMSTCHFIQNCSHSEPTIDRHEGAILLQDNSASTSSDHDSTRSLRQIVAKENDEEDSVERKSITPEADRASQDSGYVRAMRIHVHNETDLHFIEKRY